MSLLGKILLGVNLLAAVGLTYLTLQDWSKRQEVGGLALRYTLTLTGIAVDEPKGVEGGTDRVPLQIEDAPGHVTETVSQKLLDEHFKGTSSRPTPKTQLDEVREVQKAVRGLVAAQANDPDKLRVLCGGMNAAQQFEPGVLMYFADTFEERQAIRGLVVVRDPQTGNPRMIANAAQITANLAEGYRRLDRKFEAVLAAPNPSAAQADATRIAEIQGRIAGGDKKAEEELAATFAEGNPAYCRDDADRRNRIAQLLMLHDRTLANQKRTVLVVGLRVYARAVNEQLARVEEIVRRVERQIEQDQAKFQEEYELLKRLAVEQDQLFAQEQRVLAGYKDQAAEDDKHVNVRQTQLADLEKNLNEITAAVAKLLQAQADVEKSLFDVQKKVGETLRKNADLEGQLLKAEESK